jgi:hypothetical protein
VAVAAAFLPFGALVLPFAALFLLVAARALLGAFDVFFLADACRFTARFGLGRLAERRAAGFFFAVFPDFLPLTACRFDMDTPFRNLDSLAISVVLSVAYRNSEKPSGGRHPLNQPPAISDRDSIGYRRTRKAWRT